ncbi:IPT/TIG domain-containing protein (plasmid) [Streptomyces sp. HUAS TT3]|uniref:IPT/TIG domain-containing protein n=1 Tax=Streptomyces sp. HUAS TT3 TaxID=3447510 RepID=UPI003F6598D9
MDTSTSLSAHPQSLPAHGSPQGVFPFASGTTIAVGTAPQGIALTPDGTRAYVANRGSNTVSVIDTATDTVTHTIPTGTGPTFVAAGPDGTRVYVSVNTDGLLSVIDTSSNTIVAEVPVGAGASVVGVTPDGAHAYVSVQNSDLVSVVDTTTNTVTGTVPVAGAPIGLAVTPDGARVYVASLFSNTVSVIDTATDTVTGTVPVGPNPILVNAAPDGAHVYVTNVGDSTVSVIETATNTVTATVGVSSQPRLVTVSPDSAHAFVANFEPDTVSVIDTATHTVVENIDVGDGPTCIVFTPGGTYAYVTENASGSVGVMATSVIPDQGSTAGGTTVTITGHHLANATSVRFGTASAVVTANTDTSLTVTAPAGSGAVPVSVTTPGGTGTLGTFYYRPVPALTSTSPAAGPVAGSDQEITITGRNLAGAIDVYFGPRRAVIQKVSDTQLAVRTPAGVGTPVSGGVAITVITPGGRAEGLLYTYLSTPTVTGVSPSTGPTAGGTQVTITGTGLAAADEVTFNGAPAAFTTVSDTTLIATSPPSGQEGTLDITVTTPGGTTTGSFTYVAEPTL